MYRNETKTKIKTCEAETTNEQSKYPIECPLQSTSAAGRQPQNTGRQSEYLRNHPPYSAGSIPTKCLDGATGWDAGWVRFTLL